MALSPANVFIRQGIPIRVRWMGYESDTLTLSRCGWEMATQENYMHGSVDFILHHRKSGISALGSIANNSLMRMANISSHGEFGDGPFHDAILELKYFNSTERIIIQAPSEPFLSYSWADMQPTYEMVNRSFKMAEIGLFRKLDMPAQQELIVDPECVQSMLDQILKLQGPQRKEIRSRDARRDRDVLPERQIHAQIISLREAA